MKRNAHHLSPKYLSISSNYLTIVIVRKFQIARSMKGKSVGCLFVMLLEGRKRQQQQQQQQTDDFVATTFNDGANKSQAVFYTGTAANEIK